MKSKFTFAAAMIVLLTVTRLIPHDVNFTPVLAMALMSGFVFQKNIAWVPVVVSMVVVDLFLGFHSTSLFVYASVAIIAFMSQFMQGKQSLVKSAVPTTLASAVVFYLLTNLGVWAMTPMYAKTFEGLLQSYVAGLPFLKNTIVSTALYFSAMLAVYSFVSNKLGGKISSAKI